MKKLANAVLLWLWPQSRLDAQINGGEQKPEPILPFTMTQWRRSNLPWRSLLPVWRMLITEKVGRSGL